MFFKKEVKIRFVQDFTSADFGNVYYGKIVTVKKEKADKYINAGLAELYNDEQETLTKKELGSDDDLDDNKDADASETSDQDDENQTETESESESSEDDNKDADASETSDQDDENQTETVNKKGRGRPKK